MTSLIPLCSLDDIPEGSSRGFQHGELKLLVVKHKGKLVVYRNNCPHLGIPLEWVEHQFLDSSGTMIQRGHFHSSRITADTRQLVISMVPVTATP